MGVLLVRDLEFDYGCFDKENRLKSMPLGNEYYLNTVVKSG